MNTIRGDGISDACRSGADGDERMMGEASTILVSHFERFNRRKQQRHSSMASSERNITSLFAKMLLRVEQGFVDFRDNYFKNDLTSAVDSLT